MKNLIIVALCFLVFMLSGALVATYVSLSDKNDSLKTDNYWLNYKITELNLKCADLGE